MSHLSKLFAMLLIGVLYGLIFYFSLTLELRTDFTTFYTTADSFVNSTTPYQKSNITIQGKDIPVGINLNPPFFLYALQPLAQLPFMPAFFIWQAGSLLLGLAGLLFAIRIVNGKNGTPTVNYWLIAVGYLLFFPTLMNASFGQIANILFFLIMAGYYYYLQRRDLLTGLLWGLAIATKIFPGLLFVFVLYQRRYFVFIIMLLCNGIAFSLPLLSHGIDIYTQYFSVIHHITWYGDTGNASLLGFLTRASNYVPKALQPYITHLCFDAIAGMVFIWYLFKLNQQKSQLRLHFGFCLTLTTMLVLSPFAWIYYLQLLILPILLLWPTQYKNIQTRLLFPIILLLLYCPQSIILNEKTDLLHLGQALTLDSINFYGLVLFVVYLVKQNNEPPLVIHQGKEACSSDLIPIAVGSFLGIMMILNNLIPKLFE